MDSRYGDQAIIDVEVSFHKFNSVSAILLCALFNGSSQPINCHSWRRAIAKYVDSHLVLNDLLSDIVVLVPEETEKVAMFFTHFKAVEYLLDVCQHCYLLFPEAAKNPD